jgi:hypothetical protein
VTVELLDRLNNLLYATSTDSTGSYTFSVPQNLEVKVRVKAQLAAENYLIAVKDNTQSNALYVLDGSLTSSGSSAIQTRDLHASLGWSSISNSYVNERQSGPFAILDALYDSVNLVLKANPSADLATLDVFWSVDNVAIFGNISIGNIGTSLYNPNATAIYILGKADNDTDEFDNAVIQHEFGHFIEDRLSRSDSIGGAHGLGDLIDMRVAFGEGFGNAFAGMSSGQPFYYDTSNVSQQSGFGFSVDINFSGGGYYSESAIQAVLYDIFDSGPGDDDGLALGFEPILAVLQSNAYLSFNGFSSIFPFVDILKQMLPDDETAITTLLESQDINGTGPYGEGETASGNLAFSLPVYQRLELGGSVEACSDNRNQEFNGLEVRRFILLDVPAAGTYTLAARRVSGLPQSDPDIQLHFNGVFQGVSEGVAVNNEVWIRQLNPGLYTLTVYDEFNVDQNTATGGLVCFDVTFN